MNIVLASGSSSRRTLLANAGIEFAVVASAVDETLVKQKNKALAPEDLAMLLAEEKCREVSGRTPGALVIGADQILARGELVFDKPSSVAEARQHLLQLRGTTHRLISAVCCAVNGNISWRHTGVATLRMRDFSDTFVDSYLAGLGSDVMTSVGAYKLEGAGIQLFEDIDGDYFTILGLPILPLLDYLRKTGLIAA